jgi:glutamyl-tRNA reductase
MIDERIQEMDLGGCVVFRDHILGTDLAMLNQETRVSEIMYISTCHDIEHCHPSSHKYLIIPPLPPSPS